MNKFFNEVNKNFGFGMMRLPMKGEDVDYEQVNVMVDQFLGAGFNYFDTAHVYIEGHSEEAIKRCLASRYPRDKYVLTNKLSRSCFEKKEDIRPLIDLQLKACGVSYFDFLLMHAQSSRCYDKYKSCGAYEIAQELKKEGKIKHIGISFHDSAEFLDKILSENPCIEVVQIQFNYLDYEDSNTQSRLCYEVCVKHNKPVIVMEPIRGGRLIELPSRALPLLEEINCKPSNLALRFAASPSNMMMVLSGMSNIEQMEDNLSFMTNFVPLNQKEMDVASKIASIIREENLIPCTGCRYCVDGCPQKILIPDLFSAMNKLKYDKSSHSKEMYAQAIIDHNKAGSCIKCGKCERICPQKLNIRELLVKVSNEFDEK